MTSLQKGKNWTIQWVKLINKFCKLVVAVRSLTSFWQDKQAFVNAFSCYTRVNFVLLDFEQNFK
jgi:hypothetical protein